MLILNSLFDCDKSSQDSFADDFCAHALPDHLVHDCFKDLIDLIFGSALLNAETVSLLESVFLDTFCFCWSLNS